ncbi:MASE1 domain-containing protein [Actinoplanes sp. LDG1-06]|uniref:Sensor-like histidine kinase SenX3 n=1 Tax=Paractinoplanes ovalisporus TaxID=2810368 RepID=A0ABS2AGI7_9ACTN|nr:ATP-binding protein [Actinoplanes ovalisporus]MBM2618922.1 MASE1 domain-containing protein [Actinoplanes ovalisporus]
MSPLLRTLGFAALYVIATYAGRLTVLDQTNLSLVWPAAGVLAVWFAGRPRSRRGWGRGWGWADPAALVAITFAVNMATGAGATMAGFFSAANLAQAYALVWLLHRWLPTLWQPGGLRIGRLPQLWRFLLAALLSSVVGAVVGAAGLWLVHGVHSPESTAVWMARNTVGVVVVGLALRLLLHPGRFWADWKALGARWRIEHIGVTAASALAYLLVFGITHGLPVAFTLITLTVWAGVRLRTTYVVLHSLAFGTVTILFTLNGTGPFAAIASHPLRALVAQIFVATLAVVGLVLALGRDERDALVSRLRASEEAAVEQATTMATIIDSMQEGLVVIDDQGRHRLVNAAARRLIGVSRGTDQVAEAGFYGLSHADGSPLADGDSPHQRILAGSFEPTDLLVRNVANPGGRIIHVNGSVLPNSHEALLVFHDVTADRRHRDELTSFAGVVAHDLMNPLATIEGWSEVLAGEVDEENDFAVDSVVRIRRAAERMRSLIDGLLAYTTARDAGLDPAPVDLDAIVRDIATGRLDHAASTGAPMPRFDLEDLTLVRADPTLTRQLLENLIGNAIKYTAPGVVPQIVIRAKVAGDGFVRISVSDNGIGIPQGQHEAIFQNFHRAHVREGYAGTGLGLAICKRIVERHGGTITASSGDSGGSQMTFTLPVSV